MPEPFWNEVPRRPPIHRPSVIFGQRLKEARVHRGWTLRDLETEVRAVGGSLSLSRAALSRLERGEQRVLLDDVVELALALSVPWVFLCLPLDAKDLVDLTPGEGEISGRAVTAGLAWDWAIGEVPIERKDDLTDEEIRKDFDAYERQRPRELGRFEVLDDLDELMAEYELSFPEAARVWWKRRRGQSERKAVAVVRRKRKAERGDT